MKTKIQFLAAIMLLLLIAALNPAFATDCPENCVAADSAPFADVKANGCDVIFTSPDATLTLRSITLEDEDQTITVTAKDDVLEIALGALVIRAAEFRLLGAAKIKSAEVVNLELRSDPKKRTRRPEASKPSHAAARPAMAALSAGTAANSILCPDTSLSDLGGNVMSDAIVVYYGQRTSRMPKKLYPRVNVQEALRSYAELR